MPGSIGAGAGSGGSAPSAPAAPSGPGPGDGGGAATPSPISLTPESLIQAPGLDKPVKYGEFIGGYVSKADFTRAQQRVAAERDAAQKALQDQEQRFRAAAQQILHRMGGAGGANSGAAPQAGSLEATLSQLEAAPYVDGPTAANLVRNLVQTSVMPLATAIQQRDKALGILWQRLQQLDGTVGTLRNRTSEGDFQTKLSRVKTDLGLPDDPAINELLQDIYLSHEGEDLDREFPTLVKQRFEGLRTLVRALDKREADEARASRMGLPGKGGNATPGRTLRRGFQTPAEIADQLWPGGTPET